MAKETALNIRNGKVELSITDKHATRIKSKAQLETLKRLIKDSPEEALNYLKSFAQRGRRWDVADVVRSKRIKTRGTDTLADKEPQSILRLFERAFDPQCSKEPAETKLGEWIGVEIECYIPIRSLVDEDVELFTASSARRQLFDLLKERRIRNVQVKSDSSIRVPNDDYFAVEFTVLTMIHDKSNLAAVCEVLSDLGAEVNQSCGLHVHLDCRDLITSTRRGKAYGKALRRAKRIKNALSVLKLMVPHSRRSNTFCKLGMSSVRGDRYYAINCTALSKFSTIEVRLHSGTVAYQKISNWIDLLFNISRATKLSKESVRSYSELSEALPTVSRELMTYVRNRIEAFQDADAA